MLNLEEIESSIKERSSIVELENSIKYIDILFYKYLFT